MGFNVPDFYIIPADRITKELTPIKTQINESLNNIDPQDDKSILTSSEEIMDLILNYEFTSHFKDFTRLELEKTFPGQVFFSVRSSEAAEDNINDSFAGILESFLFVQMGNVFENIRKCISSNYSDRALKYKLIKGYKLSVGKMAVIIQRMIESEASGVMFTMDPERNLNENLIVAGYGQGVGIVKGIVETDEYFIDKSNKRIRKSINSKFIYLSARAEDDFKVKQYSVSKEQSDIAVLSDVEVLQLHEVGEKLENLLGTAQDIEFTLDNSRELYILQTRDITTIDYSRIKIVDNTNIVESYPGITLPLSFSFARSAYKNVFTGAGKIFKLSDNDLKLLDEKLSHMITHIKGRVYYNLHHWYSLVTRVISTVTGLKAWERLIGIGNNKKRSINTVLWKRIYLFFLIIRLISHYSRSTKRFYRVFDTEYKHLRKFIQEAEYKKVTANEWFTFYELQSEKLFLEWPTTLINDFFTFKSYDYLNRLVLSYGFIENENITNDLLSGLEGVTSDELVHSLLRLKEEIRNDDKLIGLFKNSPARILELLNNDLFISFRQKFYAYIDAYGDRTLEELKLESENMRRNPELLASLLKSQFVNDITVQSLKEKQERIRSTTNEKIRNRQFPLSLKSFIFKVVLRFTRTAIRNRENMRFCRTKAYGSIKEIFNRIGEQMHLDGIIDLPADVFYLELEDLREYCTGGHVTSKKDFIYARKEEFKEFAKLTLPDRIMYVGDIVPLPGEPYNEDVRQESVLFGTGISKGIVEGKALVVLEPDIDLEVDENILITRMTDPGWIFLMSKAKGLISEKGSILSHTAIIGRELGIPTIIEVTDATRKIKSENVIRIDGSKGTVTFLDHDHIQK